MQTKGFMGWYDSMITCCPFFFRVIHELLKIEETMGYHDPKYYASLHWSRIFEYPWVYNMLRPQENDIILDLGGGWGPLQFLLARECNQVYNFDIDTAVIPFLEAGKRTLGINNITLNLGDVEDGLPYRNCFFDKVVFLSVLEHLNPPYGRYMEDIIRVTKVGGSISCTFDVFTDLSENEEISMATAKTICSNLGLQWVNPPPTSIIAVSAEEEGRRPFTVITINLQKVKP